jgi:hypothetical protein
MSAETMAEIDRLLERYVDYELGENEFRTLSVWLNESETHITQFVHYSSGNCGISPATSRGGLVRALVS